MKRKIKGYEMNDGEHCFTNIGAVVKVIYDCLRELKNCSHHIKKLSKEMKEVRTALQIQQMDLEERSQKTGRKGK